MDLGEYFNQHDGFGILATGTPDCQINVAVYSKPVVIDPQTVALVMKEGRTHKNVHHYLNATYLFIEQDHSCRGVRLYLSMIHEERNRSLVESLHKKQPCMYPENDDSEKFLVFFRINRIRPLIGDDLSTLDLSEPTHDKHVTL